MTRLNWESRVAASEGRENFVSGTVRDLVDEVTDYLLFVDEAPPPARLTPRPRLSDADRRAIIEILRETKNDLPEFWRDA